MAAPTPWSRFVMPHQYAPDVTGAPLPGAKLYFYASGTATPLDTFSEPTLSIPNTNPVVANDAGIFPDIFLQSLQYKVMLTDTNDVEINTADPVAPYLPPADVETLFLVAEMTVDGNGGIPPVGICGDSFVPVACDLTACVLQSTQPGSLVLDVWVNDFTTNNPPVLANSIVASAPPTLGSSQSSIDTTLVGWSKHIDANSAIRYSITSIDTVITRFTLSLVASVPG
jgi:hypothetical protein